MRNTEWIYGITIFTGMETKVMKNNNKSLQKKSKIELATNMYILVTISIQTFLCLMAALYTSIWQHYEGYKYEYLEFQSDQTVGKETGFYLGTWFLALMNFVSISLLVTLEMVKFTQGIYIGWDVMMFDEEKNQPACCQSSNLNEELGMIHYIFSDKTGTLTKNIMQFKRISVGNISYGKKDPSP